MSIKHTAVNTVKRQMSATDVRTQGLDKFYTRPEVVVRLLCELNAVYPIDIFGLVVEPSAGSGSFSSRLPSGTIALDVHPEHPGVLEQNFFEFSPPNCQKAERILVVGNPPFGKGCSLAVRFFNHAATFADVIAFVIPRTFRRDSVQNRLCLHFHLVHDSEVASSPCAFEPAMSVKCCFQIWEKRPTTRTRTHLPTSHPDFEFLKHGPKDCRGQPTPPEGADFAIRAYGGKCGQLATEGLGALRPKSWHWVRSRIPPAELIRRLGTLDYSGSTDTARQNSLGKGDLVRLYSLRG